MTSNYYLRVFLNIHYDSLVRVFFNNEEKMTLLLFICLSIG